MLLHTRRAVSIAWVVIAFWIYCREGREEVRDLADILIPSLMRSIDAMCGIIVDKLLNPQLGTMEAAKPSWESVSLVPE